MTQSKGNLDQIASAEQDDYHLPVNDERVKAAQHHPCLLFGLLDTLRFGGILA